MGIRDSEERAPPIRFLEATAFVGWRAAKPNVFAAVGLLPDPVRGSPNLQEQAAVASTRAPMK